MKPSKSGTGAGARSRAPLTAPVEDYLKAIYELESHGTAAGTKELAAALRIAPASVSGMVRRLAAQGLIAYERYRGARLTDKGRRAALGTLRRHRVIEAYLAEALGYPWDRVHDEAELLEHAASDELVDRMAAAIGEPETDPHGAPIPARDGTMDERRLASLDDLPPAPRRASRAWRTTTPSGCATWGAWASAPARGYASWSGRRTAAPSPCAWPAPSGTWDRNWHATYWSYHRPG